MTGNGEQLSSTIYSAGGWFIIVVPTFNGLYMIIYVEYLDMVDTPSGLLVLYPHDQEINIFPFFPVAHLQGIDCAGLPLV